MKILIQCLESDYASIVETLQQFPKDLRSRFEITVQHAVQNESEELSALKPEPVPVE